jgi:hypothetical protein
MTFRAVLETSDPEIRRYPSPALVDRHRAMTFRAWGRFMLSMKRKPGPGVSELRRQETALGVTGLAGAPVAPACKLPTVNVGMTIGAAFEFHDIKGLPNAL